jgi:RHS repeat-associated protein
VGEQGHYPYGEEWYMTNTTTHYVFTNYHRDDESGNDYAVHRYHVNRLARFSAVDPMPRRGTAPQSLNRYSYSHNDPIGREDPSGMLDNLVCGPLGDCGGAPRTICGDFGGDIAAGHPSVDIGTSGPPDLTAFGRDPGNPFGPTDQCAPDDPSCECDPIFDDCGCDPSVFGCGCDFFSDCPLPGEGSKVGWAHYVELVALLNLSVRTFLKRFGDPGGCAKTTSNIKECGICCDEANFAHGVFCASLTALDPFGLGEALSAICDHLAVDWGTRCAKHCRDKFALGSVPACASGG